MAGAAILIAAFSGRALAQSARRAGFVPLVADGYGDSDTRSAAFAIETMPTFVTRGITRAALGGALDRLTAAAPSPPIGLVLGSGFEDRSGLVRALAETYTLIGNSPDVIETCSAPAPFFARLIELGISHPETRLDRPQLLDGWLIKRAGGSGGRHVRAATADFETGPRDYFQRRVAGEAISVLGVMSPAGTAFAFSRQWTTPSAACPYRFGGATGPLTFSEDLEAYLVDIATTLGREFGLRGLVSFDFIANDTDVWLIEINPRPGATLDVFDDSAGTLFAAHVAACQGGDPAEILERQWQPPLARSIAYLYADRCPLTVDQSQWPDWVMDRPQPATRIQRGEPVATVLAEAATPDVAETLCASRLGELAAMLYDSAGI